MLEALEEISCEMHSARPEGWRGSAGGRGHRQAERRSLNS